MQYLRLSLRSGNPRSLLAAFIYFDVSFMVWVLPGALGNFVAADLGLVAGALAGWEHTWAPKGSRARHGRSAPVEAGAAL
jgi:hypothetical protein